MKRANTILYLVVPCYNEEEVLHKSAAVLLDKLDRLIQAGTISDKSKILFINDGSKDSTWQIIYELTRQNSKYAGLSFSRNYGHQSAILAGMMAARSKADAVVTIDDCILFHISSYFCCTGSLSIASISSFSA